MKAPSAEQTLSHSLARPTTNVEDQSSCRFDDWDTFFCSSGNQAKPKLVFYKALKLENSLLISAIQCNLVWQLIPPGRLLKSTQPCIWVIKIKWSSWPSLLQIKAEKTPPQKIYNTCSVPDCWLFFLHNLKISRWFHNLYFCDILIVFVEWTAILVHPSHSTRGYVNLPEDHSSCWGSTETLHWHFLSQALTWLLDLDSGSSHMTRNCEALMLLFLAWNLQKTEIVIVLRQSLAHNTIKTHLWTRLVLTRWIN